MQNDKELLESAVAGGLIGAALGALISDNSKNGATLGAIAGAAILASIKAREQAKATNVPMLVEEEGALYEVSADGARKFIKHLPKNTTHIPSKFTLK